MPEHGPRTKLFLSLVGQTARLVRGDVGPGVVLDALLDAAIECADAERALVVSSGPRGDSTWRSARGR